MLFPTLVTAVMETSLNRLLTLDPNYKAALKPLIGKVVSIELSGVLSQRFFCFSGTEITLLENMGEAADCALSMTPSALPQLRDSHQFSELIKTDQLSIKGDVKLAQQFSDLLTQLDIDIEELLSHKLGDPLAHTLVYAGKQFSGFVKGKAKQISADFTEVAKYEWEGAPKGQELEAWRLELSQLSDELENLEQRLAAIGG